jgi:hypothetical protein
MADIILTYWNYVSLLIKAELHVVAHFFMCMFWSSSKMKNILETLVASVTEFNQICCVRENAICYVFLVRQTVCLT